MTPPPPVRGSDPQRGPGVISALAQHYRSADSAPVGFSVNRPASDVNGFVLTFVALSLFVLTGLTLLFDLSIWNNHRDLIFASDRDGVVVLPLRTFTLVFFATHSLYAHANWPRRAAIFAATAGKFLVGSLLIDVLSVAAGQHGLHMPLLAQQALSLLVAMAAFPHTILRQAQLPKPFTSPVVRQSRAPFVRLGLVIAASLAVAFAVEQWFEHEVMSLRALALLGGIGPGVFLAQQVFTLAFMVIGGRRTGRSRRRPFAPDVAILVPAHNEAHGIGATVEAVDRAARSYPGHIHVYIIDNCSADATTAAAEAALARCERITGEVHFCGTPGKAIALNHGLTLIREAFVVRIDADTVIGGGCLEMAMRHFADPEVGSVGGMPLPLELRTAIDKVRLVEVLLRHGYFQPALGGYDGVLGVPGMFAVYRRAAIDEVGGTTEGMNGEDTDICLRIAAAGYRTVADPRAVYYSETPASFAHLREQRTRWFRSIYHIAAHARPILLRGQTVTGAVVLPFMLASAARRAMLAPLLVFSILCLTVFHGAYPLLGWQPVVAVVIGMPAIVAVLACCLQRRFDALRWIPHYLVFRMIRSYFTLGSVLTLVFPPLVADQIPILAQARRRRTVNA